LKAGSPWAASRSKAYARPAATKSRALETDASRLNPRRHGAWVSPDSQELLLAKAPQPTNENAPDSVKSWDVRRTAPPPKSAPNEPKGAAVACIWHQSATGKKPGSAKSQLGTAQRERNRNRRGCGQEGKVDKETGSQRSPRFSCRTASLSTSSATVMNSRGLNLFLVPRNSLRCVTDRRRCAVCKVRAPVISSCHVCAIPSLALMY
jgi:hypothetical protein